MGSSWGFQGRCEQRSAFFLKKILLGGGVRSGGGGVRGGGGGHRVDVNIELNYCEKFKKKWGGGSGCWGVGSEAEGDNGVRVDVTEK